MKEKTKSVIDFTVCEKEFNCPKCGIVGYWAYGYFDPFYPYLGE